MTNARTILPMLMLLTLCAVANAQDYGDAPAGYGTMEAGYIFTAWPGLGPTGGNDLTNPVAPAWTGDNDDGVVGTPLWNSWSSYNTLTVNVTSVGYLVMWVDANDNGAWEVDERYNYFPQTELTQPGNYTFTGISIKRTQDFNRNGHNKCAVRITLQDNVGGPPNLNPSGYFYYGEVEDWLIDVEPAKFVVANEIFREPIEGKPFTAYAIAQNGTPPHTWSMIAGSLPVGMTLVQTGDQFKLSGTPAAGTGSGAPNYNFTLQVTDATSLVATRALTLRVLPPPTPLPFIDDFSTNKGWTLGNTWSRAPVAPFTGTGQSWDGWPATEPAFDATPNSTDNMILADSIGGSRPDIMNQAAWATSPIIDCTGINEVELRFSRWLSCGYFGTERVRVQVSNDGATWVDVWNNDFNFGWKHLCDFSWSPFTYDITAMAANQPRVQVRFGMGVCDFPQFLPLPQWYERFAGWCIDDVVVREKPRTNILVAQSFLIATVATYLDLGTGVTQPLVYPQGTYSFTASVNNTSANDVTITSFEVGTVQVGTSPFYGTQSCWINVGTFTLATPITVPASAVGFNVQGSLISGFVPLQLACLALDSTIYLSGIESGTGTPVRAQATFRFGMNTSPQPGLRVTEIQVGGTPVFNGDAPAGQREFGSVITGSSSNWLNIVLKNTASTPCNLSQAMLVGPDAGEFSISNQGHVSPIFNQTGVFSYFSIKFKPLTPGTKQCTVSFTHDATNTGTPFTFEIRGFGVANAPVLQVTENNATGPGISYGAAPANGRNFGNQDLGAGPTATLLIHVENTGTQPLILGTPLIQGADAGAFGLDLANFALSVAPGMGTEFGVFFDPATTGAKLAQIAFTHNGAGVTAPFTFDITGAGIINAPLISVTETSGAPIVPGSQASGGRQFGVQDVSSGPTNALTVVIRNNGWQDLLLGTLVLAGGNPADFVLDTMGMAFTLGQGATTSFTVAFDPMAKGVKNAIVSLTHNDTTAPSPYTFALNGLATDPNGVVVLTTTLALGQATIAYGPVSLVGGGGTTPYVWTFVVGTLPTGITLAQDGTLSGTPSVDGPFSFRVRVTDNLGGYDEKQLQIIIQPAPGALSKSQAPAGGGCTAGNESATALLLLAFMLAYCWRRKVVA